MNRRRKQRVERNGFHRTTLQKLYFNQKLIPLFIEQSNGIDEIYKQVWFYWIGSVSWRKDILLLLRIHYKGYNDERT